MLKFAEDLLHDIKRLQRDTEQLVVSGSMKNMEQYTRMMGRLEAYQFVADAIKQRMDKGEIDD
jgi:hypothetical protein